MVYVLKGAAEGKVKITTDITKRHQSSLSGLYNVIRMSHRSTDEFMHAVNWLCFEYKRITNSEFDLDAFLEHLKKTQFVLTLSIKDPDFLDHIVELFEVHIKRKN